MTTDGSFERNLVKALGHPLRLRLLEAVIEGGEESPVDLSGRFKIPLATVSRHMRMLRELGFIELTRTEPRRGALKHFYRAAEVAFIGEAEWGELGVPMRRGLARQSFRTIFHEASAAGGCGGFDAPESHLVRVVVELDGLGRSEVSQAFLAVLEELKAIQLRSDMRRASGAPVGPVEPGRAALLHFRSTAAHPSYRRTGAGRGPTAPA